MPPTPRADMPSSPDFGAEVPGSALPLRAGALPEPKHGKSQRLVALTLLDGTQIRLPAAKEESSLADAGAAGLTARDLVEALRARANGADVSEVFGGEPKWEELFATLLAVLLKKRLIADWEFVEAYKKVTRRRSPK